MPLSAPVIWTVIGVALIVLEALVPGLMILFFGLGALVTALAAFVFDVGTTGQLLIFSLASVTSLLALRKTLARIFQGQSHKEQERIARINSLLGAQGVILEDIPAGATGRVKLRGTSYTARADEPLSTGTAVRVVAESGPDHALITVQKI